MELRNPNKSHYPLVMALLDRCFQPSWSPQAVADRVYYDPHYDPSHVWMAREEGKVLGFMVTTLDGNQGTLKLLAVDPDARRKGLATDMLSRAEYRLSGEGATEMRTDSAPAFEFLPGIEAGSPAEAFFLSQGYEASAFSVTWVKPAGDLKPKFPPLDRKAAIAFGQARCGELWPHVEENLGTLPPEVAFQTGIGMATAGAGSIGPLWLEAGAPAAALEALTDEALAMASTKPCPDPRGLRFWRVAGSSELPQGIQHTVTRQVLRYRKTLA